MHEPSMSQTVDLNQIVDGYIVNTMVDMAVVDQLNTIRSKLYDALGDDVWLVPDEALHVTLLDWLAPLVNYESPKTTLYQQLADEYRMAMEHCLAAVKPIELRFNKLEVHPSAIIMVAEDDGSIQKIRNQFLQAVALLPGTKLPPQIIHSTIAKFRSTVDLQPVRRIIADEAVDATQVVDSFQLVHETGIFMQKFQAIHNFKIGV